MTLSPTFLSAEQVSREYRLGNTVIPAVNSVSLAIQRGEFLALLGSSGSGKSTLLSLLAGLDRPTSGAIRVQDRNLAERCIAWGNEGPPMLGSTYNANLQITQTPAAVAIRHEIIHGVRIVPMDGRPHVPSSIRQLGGDSRGHWEGDTLVIDTTNFTDATNFRGPPATARQDIFASRDLHVVERFTRTDDSTIVYRFTVDWFAARICRLRRRRPALGGRTTAPLFGSLVRRNREGSSRCDASSVADSGRR